MENIQYKIQEFDAREASDELCYKVMDYSDKRRVETDPDEPSPERETILLYMRDKHPHYENKEWIVSTALDGEEIIIAQASVDWVKPEHPGYEKNKSTGNIRIGVLKEYRRQGIGSQLFQLCMSELAQHPEVQYIIPGSQFDFVWTMFEKYGGTFSSEGAENRMYLSDVDWDMIHEWAQQGQELAERENVSLQMFEDCPDDILEEYVQVYFETMNQQPLGEWDGEITVTPETFRMDERRNHEKGMERYTLITREADGAISGLTEIFRHRAVAHRGMQNLTGVREQYRGRGLGKWLKAEMLLRMHKKFPEWIYIVTGNDETNAPMLSINKRMGFKQFRLFKSYKFDVRKLANKYAETHPDFKIPETFGEVTD